MNFPYYHCVKFVLLQSQKKVVKNFILIYSPYIKMCNQPNSINHILNILGITYIRPISMM